MAHSLAEMEAMRDALLRARYAGVRTVKTETEEVTYASDAEMRTALADLERRIAEARGAPRVTTIRFSTSKGL
jgi:hypothetical protein